MNGERGETFLRLLAEAELRRHLAPDPPPWTGEPGAGRVKVSVAGQALSAVGALDRETVQAVLAEFDLAVNLRRLHDPVLSPAGRYMSRVRRLAAEAGWADRVGWLPPGRPGPSSPGPAQPAAMAGGSAPEDAGSPEGIGVPEPADPPPSGHGPGQGTPDRFVPIGLTLPFQTSGLLGELHLLSFVQTGAGARLIVSWGTPVLASLDEPGREQAEQEPGGLLTVTDDRGSAYELGFTYADSSEWASQVTLDPAPPDGVRWLEVTAPPGPAVRVHLDPASGPPGREPEVSPADLSAGEQLLILLAEELLMVGAPFPLAAAPAFSSRTVQAMGTGLGAIVAGLEAVDLLPPLSPMPARLAALCASLGIDGHEITAAPAGELPEPWLSVLTYYQRRKPDTAPVRDGFAAVAAALPELDGIRLALVGLHNTQGTSTLHVLARGVRREERAGPHGVNLDFPLSLWLRDSGGRWHVARPAGWDPAGPEHAIELVLVPPLPRSTAWVEVRASGRSGVARARLPLRWGSPL